MQDRSSPRVDMTVKILVWVFPVGVDHRPRVLISVFIQITLLLLPKIYLALNLTILKGAVKIFTISCKRFIDPGVVPVTHSHIITPPLMGGLVGNQPMTRKVFFSFGVMNSFFSKNGGCRALSATTNSRNSYLIHFWPRKGNSIFLFKESHNLRCTVKRSVCMFFIFWIYPIAHWDIAVVILNYFIRTSNHYIQVSGVW